MLSWCTLWHCSGENLLMANHQLLTSLATKATKFGEITQTTRPLRRSRSFKVISFGTNRKPICDFLLVIKTNLPPILHRFQVMADYMPLHFNAVIAEVRNNRSKVKVTERQNATFRRYGVETTLVYCWNKKPLFIIVVNKRCWQNVIDVLLCLQFSDINFVLCAMRLSLSCKVG